MNKITEFERDVFCLINEFKTRLSTSFGHLRSFIYFNQDKLTQNQINALIDIFKDAILSSQLILNEKEWINQRHSYFRYNCPNDDKWREKFKNKDFSYKELTEFIDRIKETKEYDFSLRILEVTLRDDTICNFAPLLKDVYIEKLNNILCGTIK